jgi:hypothetical protein
MEGRLIFGTSETGVMTSKSGHSEVVDHKSGFAIGSKGRNAQMEGRGGVLDKDVHRIRGLKVSGISP